MVVGVVVGVVGVVGVVCVDVIAACRQLVILCVLA